MTPFFHHWSLPWSSRISARPRDRAREAGDGSGRADRAAMLGRPQLDAAPVRLLVVGPARARVAGRRGEEVVATVGALWAIGQLAADRGRGQVALGQPRRQLVAP